MIHYTTIKQSKKLLELGLSPETADMCYKTVDIDTEDDVNEDYVFDLITRPYSDYLKYVIPLGLNYKAIPCWSLGALLELIPYYLLHAPNPLSEHCYCCRSLRNDLIDMEFYGDTHLEAVYNMAVWLLENGYVKKGE